MFKAVSVNTLAPETCRKILKKKSCRTGLEDTLICVYKNKGDFIITPVNIIH